jgi:predicted unusual protein kinase regulating ubiquinone biosynthesis (AarF/ABC1/UbiB family)
MKHDGYHAGKVMVEFSLAKQQRIREEVAAILASQEKRRREGKVKSGLTSKMKQELERKQRIASTTIKNSEEFCQAIQRIVTKSEGELYFEHINEYLNQICSIARQHNVRLDSGYFKVAMSLKVIEGIAISLDPNLSIITKCIPIVLKAKTYQKLGISKFPTGNTDEDDDKYIRSLEEGKKMKMKTGR